MEYNYQTIVKALRNYKVHFNFIKHLLRAKLDAVLHYVVYTQCCFRIIKNITSR